MFDNLKSETKKPQIVLRKFSTFVTTFQEFDIDNLVHSKRNKITNYQFDEWII